MRDKNWEAQESSYASSVPDKNEQKSNDCFLGSYHEASLREVNSLLRKYNTAAPYAVRRPYFILSVELERCYLAGAEDIVTRLREMSQQAAQPTLEHDDYGRGHAASKPTTGFRWFQDVLSRIVYVLYPKYREADRERR